jgi:SAM-dependent methyltransferase
MMLQWAPLVLTILLQWNKYAVAFMIPVRNQGIRQRRHQVKTWAITTLLAATSENDEIIDQKTYIPPAVRESLKLHGHKYYCTTCAVGFSRKSNYQEHMAGRTHERVVSEQASVWHNFITETPSWAAISSNVTMADDGMNNKHGTASSVDVHTFWRDSELSDFPHRNSCIDPVWTIDTISPQLRGRFWRYLRDSFGKYYPELPSIFHHVSLHHPRYLRVKELFETLEAFKIVSSIILMAEEKKGGERGSIDMIYDLACGHGLLGILLAYRFPAKKVACVDLEARESFEAFRRAFNEMGVCCKGQETPLSNLEYREADLSSVEPEVAAAKQSTTFLVALHACNEANKDVVDMAQRSGDGTMWAVMPCCIRSKLYLNGAPVLDLDADARYQLLCGAFAEANDAQLVRAISRHITARPIIIAGGLHPSATSSIRPAPISAAASPSVDGIQGNAKRGKKVSLKKVGYGTMPPL